MKAWSVFGVVVLWLSLTGCSVAMSAKACRPRYATAHAVMDAFTFGLWELVGTPLALVTEDECKTGTAPKALTDPAAEDRQK